jgi:autotransporter-associated beta strand protein
MGHRERANRAGRTGWWRAAWAFVPWLAVSGVALAQTGYSVVSWYDEFDGPGVDPARWVYDLGTGSQFGLVGWGNNELQYYTNRASNARVANGLLEITARREAFAGMDYTSARLTTRGTFSQAGGRFEIRAALPLGQGFWPAFWMLPTGSPYGGWAASGEIDILEARGQHPNRIENTIHYGGPWPDNAYTGSGYTLPAGGSIADFHTYAVEWDLEPAPSLRWYVDDRLSWSTNQWWSTGGGYPAPFDQPFHLLVNLAVGGNFVGPPDGSTPFPSAMKVDYVRVYDSAPAELVVDVGSGSRTQFQEGLARILQADSLTKAGAGTLVLDAVNDFTGPTQVAAGTLRLDGGGAIDASALVAVASGAVFDVVGQGGYAVPATQTLAGTGTIFGDVSFGGGATLAPGAGSGTLSVAGGLAPSGDGDLRVAPVPEPRLSIALVSAILAAGLALRQRR